MSWKTGTHYDQNRYPWLPAKPALDAVTTIPMSSDCVDCRDFGCVGDNVTDNAKMLQHAIDQAYKLGKALFIPPGRYKTSKRLHIDNAIRIVGGHRLESIISYIGGFEIEAPYATAYWEKSNAAILINAHYTTLDNFTLIAEGAGVTASGIIFHHPDYVNNNYASAEGCVISHLDIKYFKNNMYIYAGWTRNIAHCRFIDATEHGIMWEPLESETVGNWSGSGDILTACQFVGNDIAGVYAEALHEFTAWNCIFEYNGRAIILKNCNDVTFKNCWNEANYANIQVFGCARFEGGYNIGPNTVDHTIVGAGDVVTFEGKANKQVLAGTEVVFNQQSGVITKGVNLGVEVSNMFANADFDVAGEPSADSWEVYVTPTVHATEVLQSGERAVFYDRSGLTEPQGFGIRQVIPVVTGKSYNVTVYIKSPNRASIDGAGLTLYVQHRNGANEPSWNDNRSLGTLAADNVWEQKSAIVEATGDDAYFYIGFGCDMNGQAYFARPVMARSDAVSANDVFIRILDTTHLTVVDMAGNTLGTLTVTPV